MIQQSNKRVRRQETAQSRQQTLFQDKNKYKGHKSKRRAKLVDGQHPYAVILTCADSRLAPEIMFDARLGDLFVVRVAGNVANTCSIASVEYAVKYLKSQLVVVLGHESCGAVGAALSGEDYGHNLNMLIAHLKTAITRTCGKNKDVHLRRAIKKNAKLTAKYLKTRSPIIAKAKPKIVPAYYHLKSGKVDFL